MKKIALTLTIVLLAGAATHAFACGWYGNGRYGNRSMNVSPAYQGSCCPMYEGGSWRGSMGRGWMNRHWMQGNWMCGGWEGHHACPWDSVIYDESGQLAQPLTQDQVEEMAEHFVANNPNLKIGKIKEKEGDFIVEIVTKKGSVLVEKVAIDKNTGMMQPVE